MEITVNIYGPASVHIHQTDPLLEDIVSELAQAEQEITNLNSAIDAEKSAAHADHDTLMAQIATLEEQLANGATQEQLAQLTAEIRTAAERLAPAEQPVPATGEGMPDVNTNSDGTPAE